MSSIISHIPRLVAGLVGTVQLGVAYALMQHKIVLTENANGEVPEEIETRIKGLAKELGIKPDVKVYVNSPFADSQDAPAMAMGLNSRSWSKPAIFFGSITKYPKDELCSMAAHELVHIKNNDPLRAFVISALALATLALYPHQCTSFIGRSLEMCGLLAVTSLVGSQYVSGREKIADLEAIKHMTKREQACYLKFFGNKLYYNKVAHEALNNGENSSWFSKTLKKLTVTPQGNYLLDFSHPLLTSRVQYVREAYYSGEEVLPLEVKVDGHVVNLDARATSKIRSMIRKSNKELGFVDAVGIAIDTNKKKDNVEIECLDGHPRRYTVQLPGKVSKSSTDLREPIIDIFNQVISFPERRIICLETSQNFRKLFESDTDSSKLDISKIDSFLKKYGLAVGFEIDPDSIGFEEKNGKFTATFTCIKGNSR